MSSGMMLKRFWVIATACAVVSACGGDDTHGDAAAAEDAPTIDPGTITADAGPVVTPGAPPAAPVEGAAAPVPAPAATPAATPAAAPAPQTGGSAQLAQQGQQVYASSVCVACHGANAQGTPLAPNLTDSEWLWAQPGPNLQAEVATVIRNGVPKAKKYPGLMPPMGGMQLSADQINSLAAYIVSLGS